MEEVEIKDKKTYLKEHYPFDGVPSLSEKRFCIHCEKTIAVGDFKVFKNLDDGMEYICCPNAPECSGTVIDWFTLRDQ